MIRDQLREAYRADVEDEVVTTLHGSTFATKVSKLPPDELVITEPEVESFPLHVDVECVAYTLSLTKSTDSRIVYERDR